MSTTCATSANNLLGQSSMDHLLSALLLFACTTPICPSAVSPSDISQASFGSFDFRELEEILYDVEIDELPTTAAHFDSKYNIQHDTDFPSSTVKVHHPKHRRLALTSKFGQQYFCTLPEDVPDIVENGDGEIRFNVSALLQPLTKRPCLTKTTGWWSYEYCHGKVINQFHKEAGKVAKTLTLGVYENETHWTEEKINKVKSLKDSMKNNLANQHYPVSYHGVAYVNGTECDIHGQPRRAKVKIFCGMGEDKIVEIQETETCYYTIHVQTQLLCAHPFFNMKSGSKSHLLECAPIISQQYYELLEKKSAMKIFDGLPLKDELQPSDADEPSDRESFNDVLTSFLSRTGLFDSGEEDEDDGEDDILNTKKDIGSNGGSDIERDAGLEADRRYSERDERQGEKTSDNGRTNFNQQRHGALSEKSTDQDENDSEEEKLALRVNRLKAAVDSLYRRMLDEFEEMEEEYPTKNLLKHALAEASHTDSVDSDSQSESDNVEERGASLDGDQASQTQQQLQNQHDTQNDQLSSDYEKESLSQTRDKLQHERSKDIDDDDSREDEPQTVTEYLEKLKRKKTNSLLSEASDDGRDLNEDELGLLEELDEEALSELETEINEELQRHLKDAGLDGQAQIEVKVFNLPASIIDNLDHLEDEGDSKDGSSSQSQRKSTSGTVKVLNVRLAGDQLFDGSSSSSKRPGDSAIIGQKPDFSKMLNSYLNPMTPERMKVQRLESGYNQARFESFKSEEDTQDSESNGEKGEESTGL